jgi:PAS domain S-box-containing protein
MTILRSTMAQAPFLEHAFNLLDEGMLVRNAQGVIAYANDAAAGLFGFGSASELITVHLSAVVERWEMADEDGRPISPDAIADAAIASVSPVNLLVRLRHRTWGEERWVGVQARAARDDGQLGNVVIMTFRETLERPRTADERVSNAWFSTTLKSIGDAVIATDDEGRIDFMNEVAETLTGWPTREARGQPLKTVFHIVNERTRFEVESPVAKVLREGVVVGLANHTVLIRRDGKELAIDDSGAPIRDASGDLLGVVLVFRDVTAKRREEERRLFLAKASAVLASSLDYATTLRAVADLAVPRVADWCLVQVRDQDGSIRPLAYAHVNVAKAKWLFEIERLYPADASAAAGVAHVLRTGRSELNAAVGEAELRAWARSEEHADMLRRIGVRSRMIVPMRARGRVLGAITLGAGESTRPFDAEDVAYAEQLAQAASLAVDNARLYAEAREANRAKDDFLATLSHELRTPLNAMLGWTRMMRLGPQSEERRNRGLLVVERNARAQARLIDDLLDVSRIVTGKLSLDVRTVDVPALVEAAVDAARPAAEAKEIRLHATFDRLLPPYAGDPDRLQQVAWNLVSNAVKFTPRGGEVWVDLSRTGSQIELRVRDTGQGIEPEFLPHVFDRFRQADASTTKIHTGLGLGLSIVKALVELHGGTVHVASPGAGQGATFIVCLPMASIRDDESSSLPPPGPLPNLKGIHILVVDDEDDNREMLTAALEQAGAEVTAVSSATEAIASYANRVPDILVSDIGMPNVDGYALIRRLRSLQPEQGGRVPAIALTAHARVRDRSEALLAGFQEHIPKPVDPAELIVAVASFAGKAPRD